jgi:hypothetical protein
MAFIDIHYALNSIPLILAYLLIDFLYCLPASIISLGLFCIINNKNRKIRRLIFGTKHFKSFMLDILRLLGIDVSSENIVAKSKKALLMCLLVLIMEGSACGAYFNMARQLRKYVEKIRGDDVLNLPIFIFCVFPLALVFVFFFAHLSYSISRRIRNRLRKLSIQSALDLRKYDTRSPVLFLRSFSYDHYSYQIALRNTRVLWNTRGVPWYAVFDPGVEAPTLEECILQNYSLYGPVIALGNPADKMSYLGVPRDYLEHDHWKDKILSLMEESILIVLVVGKSDSLAWEIEQIRRHNYLTKTIFIFPPLLSREVAVFQKVVDMLQMEADGLTSSERSLAKLCSGDLRMDGKYFNHHILILRYDGQRGCSLLTAKRLTDIDYEIALRVAISI